MMGDDNFENVLINIQLEGFNFYIENYEEDYLIAYKLIVIATDSEYEDCEFEICSQIESALSDKQLVFTSIGEDDEEHRIIGLPEIDYYEFENGNYTLLKDTTVLEAIEFLRNMKTINFSDLISDNDSDKMIY